MSKTQINAVILAGASGSRLWPAIEAKDVLIVTQKMLSDRVYFIDVQGAKFNPKNIVETIQ